MKLLYDTTTATLCPYPRQDDEPVVGLDARYLEMVLLREPQPTYDPATEQLTPTEVIDTNARTVTRGWQIAPLPLPVPEPDWATFRGGLLISPEVANLMATARQAGCEPGVTALPVALEKAQSGDTGDFAACWALVVHAGNASPELIAKLVSAAQAANLPAEFVGALQPAPERARDEQGRFVADDPATPENEAWTSPD